jgi:hypothetical protein
MTTSYNRMRPATQVENSSDPFSKTQLLHFVRHDVGRSVGTGEQGVGFGRVDELLGLRIEGQLRAEDVVHAGEAHAQRALEVRLDGLDAFEDLLGVAQAFGLRAERDGLAEPVGDIAQVAQGRGIVPFEDLGVEFPVPIAIAGGPKCETDEDTLAMIRGALDGGAAGIVMGRNIWQSSRPVPLIKAVRALIHEDISLEKACIKLKEES